MTYIQAFIIAVIEGLTEFLPVSSTGHMIIATSFMGIEKDNFTKMFEVVIQLGAILSVVVLYWKKFFLLNKLDFYFKLLVAVIPALVLGFLFSKKIDALLESRLTVSISLFVGGFILLFVDKLFKAPIVESTEKISLPKALLIGIWQCIAMIPGVSRSAASIIGGMTQKLNRQTAAEFSFFLAVPTMFAATAKKMLDFYNQDIKISSHEIKLLAFGNIVAFIVALIAIKTFIGILNKYGFKYFGFYRIIVGGILIVLFLLGIEISVV